MIAGQDNYYPWQEKKYVSLEAALNDKEIHSWKQLTPYGEYLVSRFKKAQNERRS